jgi:hypothetical protein
MKRNAEITLFTKPKNGIDLIIRDVDNQPRNYLKNASNAQLRRCKPLQNTHILPCMLRFFIGLRLALERDLLFLRQFQRSNGIYSEFRQLFRLDLLAIDK